ncbi:tyrosine-type recombinase/integrase [Sphingobium yanoikuyae]|uniref:Tyrosine-type recombinase/integrase n=1 Tax=Sphingobium yanoikuyae TaxID=13690 RepID=A0AA42X2B7_SPHYA|nr:site-specific integrase [Sphingobium yanoikuyae]MDH2134507.1 tyrosine-type recombinase/integrase [Sphingobium yanoikuyae]MDH2151924.1 tyrosine-type recombinase/integrase [Sphingobium yanoikuyae]MDH2169883.1 tyrosine-type recombinase/integrase [Sphingobium yanoikuyae]
MELKWNHQALIALKFESARYIDPKGNRLSLVVSKSSKIWRWQARVNGVPRTLTLGKFPAVGLADARAKAGAIQADHDAGVDVHVKYGAGVAATDATPAVEAKRAGMTCQQAWDRYIGGLKAGTNVHGKARNKPRTIIEKEGMWKRQWADEIGDTMMNEVTEEVLYDVIQGLRDDGYMGAANSTTRYIKAFFRWAKLEKRATGLRTNPAEDLPISQLRARDRYLTENEIRYLLTALEAEDQIWTDAYRLALLTGQRKNEIFGALRSEVDINARHITISADRMKHNRAHVVPLSPQAWKIVERRLKATTSRYLFAAADGDNHLTGFSKRQAAIKAAVSKLASADGIEVAHWSFHDLRRTVSTMMNGLRDEGGNRLIAKDHIERVLSHIIRGVEGTYDRNDYYAEKRRALMLWADHLDKIVKASKQATK